VAQYSQGLKEVVGFGKRDKGRTEEEVGSKDWWWCPNSDVVKLQQNYIAQSLAGS